MVADFHRRGVRVLFPMMMWDQGTPDPGKPWPEAIANLWRRSAPTGSTATRRTGFHWRFSLAAEKAGHPLAFEPEAGRRRSARLESA